MFEIFYENNEKKLFGYIVRSLAEYATFAGKS
jgi:hypothetical protein